MYIGLSIGLRSLGGGGGAHQTQQNDFWQKNAAQLYYEWLKNEAHLSRNKAGLGMNNRTSIPIGGRLVLLPLPVFLIAFTSDPEDGSDMFYRKARPSSNYEMIKLRRS
jgi:hypothetical protein